MERMKSNWLIASAIGLAALAFLAPQIVAAENESANPPWFLSEWQELHAKSPREASLAWFDQARLGMLCHWNHKGGITRDTQSV